MTRRSLTRRAAVVSSVGAALTTSLVLAGCDIDPPSSSSESPRGSRVPREDAELVATVVAELVRADAVLVAATLSVPDLTPLLAPVAAAHADHLELLADAIPDAEVPNADVPPIAAERTPALATVRRSERRLQREVRRACLTAASGDLGRALASVVVSTAQHGATLANAVRTE